MNFLKYNQKNHIEIQPAAMVLSGLDHSTELEMHTLDHALVLLSGDMSEHEQFKSITSLVKLVNSMMQDILANHRMAAQDEDLLSMDDTADGGLLISVGGKVKFALSPGTLAELHRCGIEPDMLVDILLELTEGEDEP